MQRKISIGAANNSNPFPIKLKPMTIRAMKYCFSPKIFQTCKSGNLSDNPVATRQLLAFI